MNTLATNSDATLTDSPAGGYQPRMLQIRGRIGRLRYIAYSLSLTLLFFSMAFLTIEVIPRFTEDALLRQIFSIAMLFSTIVMGLMAAVLTIRRLNDLNATGWAVIVALVPMINLIFTLFLVFGPGSKGENRYGRPPVPNGRNVHLALTSMILFSLLMFALFGMYGSAA
ncbi:DUF805 domain-containing protein [Halomonas aquamarina]|uniref:DUF805 domain-containing protein n=1 Tax=Vreelandella aquamarina TaxID=77097 RepID=A0ACC5VY31_9GAMM|nr:DUF805 domain-containing protein [Halomonas aquamarina]MBZ5488987.1 DUF805 domain-containing protein [Halomonas aquamarina]